MKTVLITGANSGIGKALVIKYVQEGYQVILACRDDDKARDVIHEVREIHSGARVVSVCLDLSSFESVSNCIMQLEKIGIKPQVLILNAGIHMPYRVILTKDKQELQYQTNFLSALLVTLRMLTQPCGQNIEQIVYVSSQAHHVARFPIPTLVGFWYRYALSKFDATAAFLMLAKRYPRLDVRILSPGGVLSNVHRNKPWILQLMNRYIGKKKSAPRIRQSLSLLSATVRKIVRSIGI
ncbi:MAG: putative oxidoreductase YciK [Microgenomates bacterium OLB22]|nr:MAG: putative oxidoreductase YciK [Microgenomates bacterium OLB22]